MAGLDAILQRMYQSGQAADQRAQAQPELQQVSQEYTPSTPPNSVEEVRRSRGLESLLPVLLSGGGGGGGGGGGNLGGSSNPQDLALEIARKIERRPGFQVSGLEGFQGTGQINSGHIDNSQHYSGMAGDVGYYGGGRFNGEPAALDWLERWLNRKYGDNLTELIWREPDHFDHLHYGTRPGG